MSKKIIGMDIGGTTFSSSLFDEDLNIIEGMQDGRKSPSYNGGNFSPVMDNPTHHFHKWVANNIMK